MRGVTRKGQKMTTLKQELERILETMVDDGTFFGEIGPMIEEAQDKAVQAIIELVDREIIGEDETVSSTSDNTLTVLGGEATHRNTLKAIQRAKLGVKK